MILPESYSKEWIYSHRAKKGFEGINPPLAEKMIHALGLAEALAASELDFIFKGGTSLILLISTFDRFSIDIDIITQAGREQVERVLKEICHGKPFIGFKLNERRSYQTGVPKAHYSLTYNSVIVGREDHILLDILFDDNPYAVVLEVPIETAWLKTDDKKVLIKIPSCESITGDKLTAFAPNTTGIPYKKGKELDMVKQLNDVGKLYHEIKDMSVVIESFNRTVDKEIKYRGNICTRDNVIQDIIDTALLIAKREKNKEEPYKSNFAEIHLGLKQFRGYQINSHFRIDEAITASAKAALLASKLKSNNINKLELFSPDIRKDDCLFEEPALNFLNKLQIEPLFYWSQAFKNLEDIGTFA
ncbi:MAG TPA: nucleotidyl transferase AbiEii/AbiGii toxin family protein [Chitinophagaceae bacterium]|nr:nucleotidyl transferase AbiEii/AbiGii toxin family protein [Chitinophagaceae bacterium]